MVYDGVGRCALMGFGDWLKEAVEDAFTVEEKRTRIYKTRNGGHRRTESTTRPHVFRKTDVKRKGWKVD